MRINMTKQGRGLLGCLIKEGQEYLFPVFCFGCNAEGAWLCCACLERDISVFGVWCCPVCHAPQTGGVCCQACVPASSLASHIAIMPYAEQSRIADILHAIKYQYAEDAFSVIDAIVKSFFLDHANALPQVDIIVPVPLHRRRYAERGFNQAEEIARRLGANIGIPSQTVVSRGRYTEQQAKLSRDERQKNMTDAFIASAALSGKRVLLVDDVYTTGSTMQSCAKALLDAGADVIHGFTVARG